MTIDNAMNQVLIGLGSNLYQPIEQVKEAINVIKRHPKIKLVTQSSLYSSSPQGPQDQEDFINAVVWIETPMAPPELLLATQAIENQFGRVKTRHWGERVIDLDILFFNQDTFQAQQPDLTIPHPYALERDFVLIPTLEIAADWLLPDGSKLHGYQSLCLNHNLKRIE